MPVLAATTRQRRRNSASARSIHGIGSGSTTYDERPCPVDSAGNLWNAGFVTATGNLLADFRFNVTAESQRRLQACRLYNMTDDTGVRDMLSFLIARDTMHQKQWITAVAELELDGLEATPIPSLFPRELEKQGASYQQMNFSQGEESTKATGHPAPPWMVVAPSSLWRARSR